MDIELNNISYKADLYEVKEAFASILHGDNFVHDDDQRLLNFKVVLGKSDNGRHDGTGLLTIPNRKMGQLLLDLARKGKAFPMVHYRRVWMKLSEHRPSKGLVDTLRKVPYMDPSIDREREDRLLKLNISLRIDTLQFGIWLSRPRPINSAPEKARSSPILRSSDTGRDGNPFTRKPSNGRCSSVWSVGPPAARPTKPKGTFAVEWEKDYTAIGNAQLWIEYDHKIIRIQLGDPSLDYEAHSVVVKFSNLQNMWTGFECKPYICFELLAPAILESEWFNRTLTGVVAQDTRKFRQRVGAIDDSHRRVAPYAHQIRVMLYQDSDLAEFDRLCSIAGLRSPRSADISSEKRAFFSSRKLLQVKTSLRALYDFPWTIAFQIECLLHNGCITTSDLLNELWNPLCDLIRKHPAVAGFILRDYARSLTMDGHGGNLVTHFQNFCSTRSTPAVADTITHSEGLMACHHVTFTPTRMILEGPYVTHSNRVLRRYIGFHDNFLRVDFRDEDRLQYRWDREVDGTTFLQERVGGILKHGFELAGRQFEFLAYSSSALREHAVWFMCPFFHSEKGHVDAASIRKEEGNFSDSLLTCPAKFAARLAQAFTATDPSVKVTRAQWKVVKDLGDKPYLHTDGVGKISSKLAKMIWAELCRYNPGFDKKAEPSAYQIRFLGFKGVVCIDDQLKDIMMHLRPSMKKFETNEDAIADIEIAKAFHSPGTMYLNRPLVMLLEDRGVKKEAFLDLLDKAIADVWMAKGTIEHFVSVMKGHGLGLTYGVSAILQKLHCYGLDLKRCDTKYLKSPFLNDLVHCAVSSILRDIKYRCRIPVTQSWTLVGVADEGPAYVGQGLFKEEEVFTLQEGEIFACIKLDSDSEPMYLEKNCNISRSPIVHPGDVQRVYAVGKPPADKICAFRNLVNVVVFPSRGKRSLASCLSGGDLDGDIYDICQYYPLFFNRHEEPADFPSVPQWQIDIGKLKDEKTGDVVREKVIPYVCDFIVEYINSDVLGLLSDNHLTRADQSSEGFCDRGCIQLAKLCNEAVDYPKNGVPVDISKIPHRLIPHKPDWKRDEDANPRDTDFYISDRALGHLYRRVEMEARPSSTQASSGPKPLAEHPIYIALKPAVESQLLKSGVLETSRERVQNLFRRYWDELRYICATHTLTDHQGVRLSEAEVVIGTILAQCSQHRWRKERIYRMGLHASNLVKSIKREFAPKESGEIPVLETKKALEFAWTAWKLINERLESVEAKESFGMNSFNLIALNVVFDCLDDLDPQRKA